MTMYNTNIQWNDVVFVLWALNPALHYDISQIYDTIFDILKFFV